MTFEKKALIAMSGGVDSAAAALLMKNAGFECAGATMLLHGEASENACGALPDAADARDVCELLGIPHRAYDFSEEFQRLVIESFVRSYEAGETPNPCIECNRFMKFGALLRAAEEQGCGYVVTGHYARVERDEKTGRYLLKKAKNAAKDQSYVLYFLNQEQLAHIILPLGDFADKADVRRLAEENGFSSAHKGESQDICFIPDGDHARFIREYTGRDYPQGDFLLNGEVIGRHKGIIGYTVGQRRGLGISYTEPLYVCGKSASENAVTLGTADALFSSRLTLHNFNLISIETLPDEPLRVFVRTRYHAREAPAVIFRDGSGAVTVCFDEPQRAVAPGQAAVAYDGDVVVGGGTIRSTDDR